MTRKKRRSKTRDIIDLTALSVGSAAATKIMYSLPATPQVPLTETAKSFTGTVAGLAPLMKGTSILKRNMKELEKAARSNG